MYFSSSPICDPREAGLAAGLFLWSPQGKASRRQWWLGHISAVLLAGLGLVGATGVLVSMADEIGLEESGLVFRLLCATVASLCLLQFAIASNALCRRRLSERGEPHDLADAFVLMVALEAVLMLGRFASAVAGGGWPLPAAPHWLASGATFLFLVSLAALVLECGVLEHWSLTELWRGRGRQLRAVSGD
jgi:uncharacterized membrane protein YhaH (DUF805 family)